VVTSSPAITGYSQSSPGRADAGHPTFARLTSAQSVAEQTRPNVVAFVPAADRRAPPIRRDRRCAHWWCTPPSRTVMIVAILDDETPWRSRHLEWRATRFHARWEHFWEYSQR